MADEPERRIVGAVHAELEAQEVAGKLSYLGIVNTDGTLNLEGTLDLYSLARAIINEIHPPAKPRLIEFDLPVSQTTWEVDMKPRNVSNAVPITVTVVAPNRAEAISKALSAKPGHVWGAVRELHPTRYSGEEL